MKSSISARFNAELLDQKYDQWCEDPQSVEADWCAFFEGFELGNAQLKQRQDSATPQLPSLRRLWLSPVATWRCNLLMSII